MTTKVSSTIDVVKKDGTIVTVAADKVLLHVHNDETKLVDTFQLKFDVQGSTYTLLLSKFKEAKSATRPPIKDGRMVGIHSERELIENIGDDGDIRKEPKA